MPIKIDGNSNSVVMMRISGVLKQAEFEAQQVAIAQAIDAGAHPRVLAILENFEGWERNADWDDLDFQLSHGNEIGKIAIVGDPQWETLALAFAGVGFRRAPVKFFPADQETEARTWIAD